MTSMINRRFGTFRGLVRAALALAELAVGRLRSFTLRRPESVRRVVPAGYLVPANQTVALTNDFLQTR